MAQETTNAEVGIKSSSGKTIAKAANASLFCSKRVNSLVQQVVKQAPDPTYQLRTTDALRSLQNSEHLCSRMHSRVHVM